MGRAPGNALAVPLAVLSLRDGPGHWPAAPEGPGARAPGARSLSGLRLMPAPRRGPGHDGTGTPALPEPGGAALGGSRALNVVA
eukprot:8478803-Alexandrium_andersonii.AAC.1